MLRRAFVRTSCAVLLLCALPFLALLVLVAFAIGDADDFKGMF